MNGNNLGTPEEQAARMGWVPKEQFKGDPERWVPAEQYIERAETILPMAKGTIAQMQKLMADQEANFKRLLAEQKAEFDALKESAGRLGEFAKKAEQRGYERGLKELRAKQVQAATDGDVAGVEAIGKEIEEHIKSHPMVTGKELPEGEKPGAGTDKPPVNTWIQPGVFDAWRGENKWYDTKPSMRRFANDCDTLLMETKPTQSQPERLAEIAKMVQEEFPDYFSNPRRERPGGVEGGERGGERPKDKAKSYANLTPEAKACCDEFSGKDGKGTSGTIPGFTREDYIAQAAPELFQ